MTRFAILALACACVFPLAAPTASAGPRADDAPWAESPKGRFAARLRFENPVYPWHARAPQIFIDLDNRTREPVTFRAITLTHPEFPRRRGSSYVELFTNKPVEPGKSTLAMELTENQIESFFNGPASVIGPHVVHVYLSDAAGLNTLLTPPATFEILPPGIRKRADLADWLQAYEPPEGVVAGFVPATTDIVLGEPILVTLVLINNGKEVLPVSLPDPDRHRHQHCRSQYTVIARDAEGKDMPPVPPPRVEPILRGPPDMGVVEIPSRESVSVVLDLRRFVTIDKPGRYSVVCLLGERPAGAATVEGLNFSGLSNAGKAVTVGTDFDLTVRPQTPANIARVLNDRVALAREARGKGLREVLASLREFHGDGAIPLLADMLERGDAEHRAAAVEQLKGVTDDAVVAAITRRLEDGDDTVAVAAAGAIAELKTAPAVDTLLAALPKARPAVAPSLVRLLGKTGDAAAVPPLGEALRAGKSPELRRAAVDALATLGVPDAVALLLAHAADTNEKDMDLREFVVARLVVDLRQPLDCDWLVPVIRSRAAADSLGKAPELLQKYGGQPAVAALVRCFDFTDPSPRHAHNARCHDALLALDSRDRPDIAWRSELKGQPRPLRPANLENNQHALEKLAQWLVDWEKDHPAATPFKTPVFSQPAGVVPTHLATADNVVDLFRARQWKQIADSVDMSSVEPRGWGKLYELWSQLDNAGIRYRGNEKPTSRWVGSHLFVDIELVWERRNAVMTFVFGPTGKIIALEAVLREDIKKP